MKTILIAVFVDNYRCLSKAFIDYDTKYMDKGKTKFYKLPETDLIILLLLSESPYDAKQQLWTTKRRHTPEKEKYYRNLVGQEVEIKVIKDAI